jgi:Phage terminase large subunit gpA, ATPase domain
MTLPTPSELPAKAAAFRARVLSRLEPPASLRLAEWAEANIVLPAGPSARPGHYRNWPYVTEILDAIGARGVEYVSLMKGTRLGFTKSLMIAIGATATIDPCPIGLLVPVDDDARDYGVDELEPLFQSSPALRGLFVTGRLEGSNTMTRKRFTTGATLKSSLLVRCANCAGTISRRSIATKSTRWRSPTRGIPSLSPRNAPSPTATARSCAGQRRPRKTCR